MPRREFIKTNVETTKTNYNYSMKMAKGKDEEKARKSVHISSAGDSRCWHISAWLARAAVILAGVESVECVSPVFISVLHFCSLPLSVFFSLSVCLSVQLLLFLGFDFPVLWHCNLSALTASRWANKNWFRTKFVSRLFLRCQLCDNEVKIKLRKMCLFSFT